MAFRKKMAHLLHIYLQWRLLATLISPTTIWTIILWLSVPSLRGSFSLGAQNSFILQLLMPYALYCASMVYKAWNACKQLFDSNAARKFLRSIVYFLILDQGAMCFHYLMPENRSRIMSHPRILTELTLPKVSTKLILVHIS